MKSGRRNELVNRGLTLFSRTGDPKNITKEICKMILLAGSHTRESGCYGEGECAGRGEWARRGPCANGSTDSDSH